VNNKLFNRPPLVLTSPAINQLQRIDRLCCRPNEKWKYHTVRATNASSFGYAQ
jgi:hypothetical protein